MAMQSNLYFLHLPGLVRDGLVPVATLDQSVRRVLAVKHRLGLFDDPFRRIDLKREKARSRTKTSLALAREAGRKSIVMLKNDGDLLPLPKSVGDERHRLVLSGIVDLPLGFQFSMLNTFGSGQAYNVVDETEGTQPGQRNFTVAYPKKNCIKGVFAFCEVNLTLAKKFRVFGEDDQLEVAVDLLNAFNNKNFSGLDEAFNNSINPDTGQVRNPFVPADIGNSLLTLPRRIQFRVGYRF